MTEEAKKFIADILGAIEKIERFVGEIDEFDT